MSKGLTVPSGVQLEILRCLADNDTTMPFEDLKWDLSTVSTPQGLGRSISAMLVHKWVETWEEELPYDMGASHTISITRRGEDIMEENEHTPSVFDVEEETP